MVPGISNLLQPLEDVLRKDILPVLTGRCPPNDLERQLFALPAQLGGLGIVKPPDLSGCELDISTKVCAPLIPLIVNQNIAAILCCYSTSPGAAKRQS